VKKVWKDGRIVTVLDDEEKEKVKKVMEKSVPSNKEIVELLKLIIEILIS